MSPLSRLILPAFLMIAAFAVACGGDDADATTTATPTATTATSTAEPTATGDASATETATAGPTETVVPADGSATTETQVVEFVPEPAGEAEAAEAAECFSESLASDRADAWRCSMGNVISDPCFALDDRQLRCDLDPLTEAPGILVEAAEPLAERADVEDAQVWLLDLADGTICGFMTGATGGLDGDRLNYGCTNGEWILGFPEAGADGGSWTAEFVFGAVGANGFEATDRHTENIATVWR